MNIKKVACSSMLLSFLCSLGLCHSARASDADEAAAVKAALNWVALVDQSKYGQSWTEAASYFKSAVKKDAWSAQVKSVREPLGKVISRSVKSKKYSTTLPGAPDGEYVVIQFETKFEFKTEAIETVTPKKEKDGQWKVSGYFIR